MKKMVLTIVISFSLAVLSVEGTGSLKRAVPIVFELESLPKYGRKKPLKYYMPRA